MGMGSSKCPGPSQSPSDHGTGGFNNYIGCGSSVVDCA